MKCPHCEKEIPGSPCPECGAMVFEDANYCMSCGVPLKEELKETSRNDDFFDDDEGFDPEERVLCPDGTCTGIIVDGKCTECGKAVGDETASGEIASEDPAEDVEQKEDETEEEKKEEKEEKEEKGA